MYMLKDVLTVNLVESVIYAFMSVSLFNCMSFIEVIY